MTITSNLVKEALQCGGEIVPLLVPAELTNGTGLMNPSIYNDDGKLIAIIRHTNYTLFHSEKKQHPHHWGPLQYIHPEDDMHLRTWNYYAELDDSLQITRLSPIDTTKFDTYEPQWDFVGLEDARLFRWDGKLYHSGVRRDTTTNGQGRMELSELQVTSDAVQEINRYRIEPPLDKNSYCEKNWMPVLDKPYHYVKWCDPTEVVKANISDGTTTQEVLTQIRGTPTSFRGGSQVLELNGYYFALTHDVDLFNSEVERKDGVYTHRFVMWDKNWNLLKWSPQFSFMGGDIEFVAGMCEDTLSPSNILITFGFQDNAAYVLRMPKELALKLLEVKSQ